MEDVFNTADEVEQAFYKALENKDIEAMSGLWLDADSIACIHPMGARLQGRRAVLQSWQQIFSGDNTLTFKLGDITRQQSGNMAAHILHEFITPDNAKDKVTVVVTTNLYEQSDEHGWRMVLHHASLSPRTVIDRKDDTGQAEKLH